VRAIILVVACLVTGGGDGARAAGRPSEVLAPSLECYDSFLVGLSETIGGEATGGGVRAIQCPGSFATVGGMGNIEVESEVHQLETIYK